MALAKKSRKTTNMFKPYYQNNRFTLYHEDCLQVLSTLPENSVDMIFADPPYNLSNGGFSVASGKRVDVHKGNWDKSFGVDKDFSFHVDWITACRRVLKDKGTIWISGTYHSIYQCGFVLQMTDYRILNDIAWYKPNASPNIGCRCFAASHESVIWACKDKKAKYTFNYADMKHSTWGKDFIKRQDKQMRSVWAINTTPSKEKTEGKHPTQKPLELLKRIIIASTKEEDVVLDPFTGSSTTGIVSHLLKRNFIGIDIKKDFLDLSIRRFKNNISTSLIETQL